MIPNQNSPIKIWYLDSVLDLLFHSGHLVLQRPFSWNSLAHLGFINVTAVGKTKSGIRNAVSGSTFVFCRTGNGGKRRWSSETDISLVVTGQYRRRQ